MINFDSYETNLVRINLIFLSWLCLIELVPYFPIYAFLGPAGPGPRCFAVVLPLARNLTEVFREGEGAPRITANENKMRIKTYQNALNHT